MRSTYANLPLRKTLLALVGAALCFLAWPPMYLFPLIFIAFVPLLLIEEECYNSEKPAKLKLWINSMLFFIAWNLLTTWWVKNASFEGFIGAFLLNSLFMSIPVLLFHQTRKKLGDSLGYFSFVLYWLSFEHLHQTWELAWPWLNLGNVFAAFPSIIQWYEIVGTSGGALWILLVNLLFFFAFKNYLKLNQEQVFSKKWILKPALLIVLPIIASLVRYSTYVEEGIDTEIVVVQPNIDPYTEKFDDDTKDAQMDKFLSLSAEKLTSNTSFLVWPETSIPSQDRFWLDKLERNAGIKRIKSFLKDYPKLNLVSGIEPLKRYEDRNGSPTARNFRSFEGSYDVYNSAIQLNSEPGYDLYHKSKLVPGVERMPYPQLFRFLEPLAVKMEGTIGSRGMQDYRGVFFNQDSIGVGPAICYESVFGDYVTEYVRRGANFIFIVTNDGWWGDTPGHKQHKYYASLRAIENRRSIARSANTGISCFVNQRGDVSQELAYTTGGSISGTIKANSSLTFYSRHGDFIYRIALLIALILATYTLCPQVIREKLKPRRF